DRLEDIPELASHFVREAARRFGVGAVRLTGGALAALGAMSWPGNVRQLEHMITSMVALGDGADLDETSLSREGVGDRESAGQAGEGGAPRSLQERLEAVERSIICEALASCGNNRSQAARVLGMRRTTLLDRMARLGLRERGSSRRDDSTPAHPEVVS
ncbi:MAG TPA: helix-turn-helix domain-containing protein, partial [Polyangiaceae bacterium]|nr:helix-turn-helix domain-containing protein [Polyangiaceae bacterium]